ncbi:MAG TPA: DUF4386 family protein [Chloroflexota bacterium]|nr:DUF4386 family protein [Chloroflexota bacterium]
MRAVRRRATATSLLTHESVFRLGLALNLISLTCYVGVAALFYRLFKPVNRNVALVAAFFSPVRIGIWVSSALVLLFRWRSWRAART